MVFLKQTIQFWQQIHAQNAHLALGFKLTTSQI